MRQCFWFDRFMDSRRLLGWRDDLKRRGGQCGSGGYLRPEEPGAGAADPTDVSTGSGLAVGSGWITAFGVATIFAPARMLTVGAVRTLTGPFAVLWSWCWCSTTAVKTPSMTMALAKATKRELFECAL